MTLTPDEWMETPSFYVDHGRVSWNSSNMPHNTFFDTISGRIEVGPDCLFGFGIYLLAGTHDWTKFGAARASGYPTEGHDIILEEGVWLASRVTVLGPCHIGKHAVISACSVVRGDIPEYSIYAGNPAKMIWSDVRKPMLGPAHTPTRG